MTDPVKLVIRDADDRTVLETEYGRDLSIVCWPFRACVVYRYDGLTPILPQNVWRLEGRRLVEARSPALMVLGVFAPLREHAGGYVFSFVSLGVPFLVHADTVSGASDSAEGRSRSGDATQGGASISHRDGPGGRRGRRRCHRLVPLDGLLQQEHHFEEPPVEPPLEKARITRVKGVTKEVFATVAPGVKIADVVNLDLFDGFDAGMTREEAEQRVGPASGRWTDPVYELQASYYDRPGGRISVVRQGAAAWWIVGHPAECTHEHVFRDQRLRGQLLEWLPPSGVVQVNVLRDVGWGGLSVHLSRGSCTHLVLTARDGDPGW
jgi:hypothetical protein